MRRILRDQKVKQVRLAEEVGVEPPAVSRWVNGVDLPSPKHLNKICEFLGVSELDLFRWEDVIGGGNNRSKTQRLKDSELPYDTKTDSLVMRVKELVAASSEKEVMQLLGAWGKASDEQRALMLYVITRDKKYLKSIDQSLLLKKGKTTYLRL